MITRIVKMTFQKNKIDDFQELFRNQHTKIKAFEGCQNVVLYQDIQDKSVFFTYSHWDNEKALEAYRHSDVFKSIWKATKALFSEKAAAWSLSEVKVAEA